MSLVFLYSRAVMHWGFIVRQLGASAAQLAYVLPPPPTVVGSFMNPLARILGLSESLDPKAGPAGSKVMSCALLATFSAAAGLDPRSDVGVAVHAEPSRITAGIYKTGGDYERALKQPPYLAADRLLPVQAVGATSSPGGHLVLAWLVDISRLSECLGVNVEPSDLKAAAWSVYRVGSREGRASIADANVFEEYELEPIPEGGMFESILYQSEECTKPLTSITKVTLYDTNYRQRSYFTPSLGGPSGIIPLPEAASFELKSGCKATRPRGYPSLTLSYTIEPGVV